MARLSDIKTKDLVRVLVVGEPGTGKTIFAAGFPLPIKYLDFDNKISSAARYYASDKERLEGIDVTNLSAALNDDPINEFMKIVGELSQYQKQGTYPFRTLVIDSITTFSAACLQHIVKTNPGINRVKSAQGVQPGMQDFGILKREFQRLISGLLTLDMNVVMLGHVSIDKDENTGELLRGVQMDGSFAQQLPIYFEEVYRSYIDDKGKHVLQTKSDSKFKCRSQIPGLPAVIPTNYDELIKPKVTNGL